MGKDRLVLADGTEITLESSQGMGALSVWAADKAAACALWDRFTKENLGKVAIKNPQGETTGDYTGMVLDHITGTEDTDGTVLVTFCLRGKTTEELLEERIASLEAGQQIQNEAIGDLGQAVSDMAEGGVQ
ncbi:MAG: hypothetical protein NC331_16035 [Lachnospiraceae bacterium]|nr:hypothetical protein [Lachnospiraceae bacterium]MCM1240864.1 hypothetical protein [Lachnospiraceae bacterium]